MRHFLLLKHFHTTQAVSKAVYSYSILSKLIFKLFISPVVRNETEKENADYLTSSTLSEVLGITFAAILRVKVHAIGVNRSLLLFAAFIKFPNCQRCKI